MSNYNSIYRELENHGFKMRGGVEPNDEEHTFFVCIPLDFTEFDTTDIVKIFKTYNLTLKGFKLFAAEDYGFLVHLIAS